MVETSTGEADTETRAAWGDVPEVSDPTIAVALFGVLLAGGAAWMRGRDRRRLREAEARIRDLERLADGVAHDLKGLLSVVSLNLRTLETQRDADVVSDAAEAIEVATGILSTLRAELDEVRGESWRAESFLRLQAALYRRVVPVNLVVDGTLPTTERPDHVARILQNLFSNAVRAARTHGGAVDVRVEDGVVRIRNRVGAPGALEGDVYRRAPGRGVGLATAHELASTLDWRLHHELDGDRVAFVLDARRAPLP